MKTYTINQFKKEFPDDNACLDYIFTEKFGDTPVCPKCGKEGSFYRVKKRKCYACSYCAQQLHPTKGTIFEKSSTSLTNWFYALYMVSKSKNGLSGKELQRHLGVTYKTAWRMNKEIRKLMYEDTTPSKGTFEADETYIGGRMVMRDKMKNKTAVMGVVKRGGKVHAKVVDDKSRYQLMNVIREHAEKGSELMTDEAKAYMYAGKEYKHDTVTHSKKEYARGKVHTNTIEGFWSHLKRSMDGTYLYVSPKYLPSYLEEFAFHYNHRDEVIFPLLLKKLVR